MKQGQSTTVVAGIDVGKHRLDIAVHGSGEQLATGNTVEGLAELLAWLEARGVRRIGMEASGGYERLARETLAGAGLEVVLHQPLEVRLFARLKRRRAKNDRLDAQLIAAATAQVEAVKAAADPALADLAERLTVYERISDQAAELKVFREHLRLPELLEAVNVQIAGLLGLKRKLAAELMAKIKAHPALLARWRLLQSLPGVGAVVAAALTVRMPELGSMKRGQAAALLGVAPYDHDSGAHRGQRFIDGGRERPRRMVYLAALAAKRSDPDLKAFAGRLAAAGKPSKCVTVAVMRKLIEAANLILARGQPWLTHA